MDAGPSGPIRNGGCAASRMQERGCDLHPPRRRPAPPNLGETFHFDHPWAPPSSGASKGRAPLITARPHCVSLESDTATQIRSIAASRVPMGFHTPDGEGLFGGTIARQRGLWIKVDKMHQERCFAGNYRTLGLQNVDLTVRLRLTQTPPADRNASTWGSTRRRTG